MKRKQPSEPKPFEPSLVIDIEHQPIKKKTIFSKPDKALNGHLYSIDEKDLGEYQIRVAWYEDTARPVCLEFRANHPIAAIGFSNSRKKFEKHTRVGPCGGTFFLRADLDGETNVALVENWGHRRKKGRGYHFKIWLKMGATHKPIGIDPQIYNDGTIHDPDGEPKK